MLLAWDFLLLYSFGVFFGGLAPKNSKTLSSYIGLLKHGNTQKVKDKVLKLYVSGNWEP